MMSAQPVQKDGAWWRQDDAGAWLKWDQERGVWVRQVTEAEPPPPPKPAATPAVAGASTIAAAGAPVAPFRAEASVASSGGGYGKYIALALLVVAAGVAAFVGLRSGSAAPGAEEVDAAFAPLTGGYTYVAPPAEVMEQVDELKASDPEAAEVIAEIDMRAVRRGSLPLGAVVIMSFDPSYLEEKPEDNILIQQVENQYGYALAPVDLAGVSAYETTVPGASAVLFFDDDGLMILVGGMDKAAVRDIAEQLAVANR